MVPLLLIIALLSVTGTFVESASNKTVCDEEPSNDQCNQYGCVQQPCSILCGQSSPYDRCTQQCNSSTCNSMVCTSSVNSCLQECPSGGICKSFGCDANDCNQKCKGGDCGVMMCASSSNCEQIDGSVMICHSKSCRQVCGSGKKCNMTCSSDVQNRCIQRCLGECFYQCDIQPVEKCQLECVSGNCTKIESPTSPKPTSKATDKPTTSKATDKGIGARQMGVLVSVAFSLMFAFVAFV